MSMLACNSACRNHPITRRTIAAGPDAILGRDIELLAMDSFEGSHLESASGACSPRNSILVNHGQRGHGGGIELIRRTSFLARAYDVHSMMRSSLGTGTKLHREPFLSVPQSCARSRKLRLKRADQVRSGIGRTCSVFTIVTHFV